MNIAQTSSSSSHTAIRHHHSRLACLLIVTMWSNSMRVLEGLQRYSTSPHIFLRGQQQSTLKMSSSIKEGFHIRNKHRSRYDFPVLINAVPQLKEFVKPNQFGDDSINWANATAVSCLNKALLVAYYSVEDWVIPQKFLTPPIPSRADYIHHVADLIHTYIPPTAITRCLDIGTGANCIYPLIGHAEYKWHFVGTDVDSEALEIAQNIVTKNKASIGNRIQFRQQTDPQDIFLGGIIRSGEKFACSFCNPPFHATEVRKDRYPFISFFSYSFTLVIIPNADISFNLTFLLSYSGRSKRRKHKKMEKSQFSEERFGE